MNVFKVIFLCVALNSCVSTNDDQNITPLADIDSRLPSWIINPHIDGGIAIVNCITFSIKTPKTLLKVKTLTLARVKLVKYLRQKIKIIQKKQPTDDRVTTSIYHMEQDVHEIVNRIISKIKIPNLKYITFPDNTEKLCVMIVLEEKSVLLLVDQIINYFGVTRSERSMLYHEIISS